MRKRRRFKGRRNRRAFRNSVRKVHKKNIYKSASRGGYHL